MGRFELFFIRAPSWWQLGIVAHEIGHAIGFYHEHNRPDRDNYVHINYNNIATDHKGNFRLASWDDIVTLGIPYDYSSLMHYRGTVSDDCHTKQPPRMA